MLQTKLNQSRRPKNTKTNHNKTKGIPLCTDYGVQGSSTNSDTSNASNSFKNLKKKKNKHETRKI